MLLSRLFKCTFGYLCLWYSHGIRNKMRGWIISPHHSHLATFRFHLLKLPVFFTFKWAAYKTHYRLNVHEFEMWDYIKNLSRIFICLWKYAHSIQPLEIILKQQKRVTSSHKNRFSRIQAPSSDILDIFRLYLHFPWVRVTHLMHFQNIFAIA